MFKNKLTFYSQLYTHNNKDISVNIKKLSIFEF